MGRSTPTFWAKTLAEGRPGISVLEHMLNVGSVAHCLAERTPNLLERFEFLIEHVGALAALHDLGKISPGFQRKCKAWLEENGLQEIDERGCWDTCKESDHGKVTHAAVQAFLIDQKVSPKSASCIAALLGAHHGRIKGAPTSRPYRVNGISENQSGIDWDKERYLAAEAVVKHFASDLKPLALKEENPSLWWLAGLTTVADWIGSDERHFPAEGGLCDEIRLNQAQTTLNVLGFQPLSIQLGIGFPELFGFPSSAQPNDMQIQARELIRGPGVYVIEAPMGMGKTEAALWASYELLAAGKAKGIYFALPTQATSNRIHLRMNEFVRRIAPDSGPSRLIHGNSWLLKSELGFAPAGSGGPCGLDARVGTDWFASSKRSLLAPFGVGTIDQALLGVVAAKHFFVRHYALAGKVVILDEVHSYDLYTGTLVDRLVQVLKGLGCTVIILSATLTNRRRAQMVSLNSDPENGPGDYPYPMIAAGPEGQEPVMAPANPPHSKTVKVVFQDSAGALAKAIALAESGGVVLWICNTVGAAQNQFDRILHRAEGHWKVGLLHSRFPFWRREELESEWMERLGKKGVSRCGCILVSTQIVEQSVDLDADLLVTELAPTDMLFQRMGRLWRHERPGRRGQPEMLILDEAESLEQFRQMDPKAIVKAFGTKAFVYSPYVLLRSLEVWKAGTEVVIPGQIRERIEATYEGRFEGEEPESWQRLFEDMEGRVYAYRQKALESSNIWTVALDDEEGVETRLNEIPTVALVLCQSLDSSQVVFLDGTDEPLGKDVFRLALAQKIHKNLVRVPRHLFDMLKPHERFETYLHGEYAIGIVDGGVIQVEALRKGIRLHWSLEEGVSIAKDLIRSQE